MFQDLKLYNNILRYIFKGLVFGAVPFKNVPII